jgi:hypothetical protein
MYDRLIVQIEKINGVPFEKGMKGHTKVKGLSMQGLIRQMISHCLKDMED